MLSRFTYFVNVSCSCAASISSVLLHGPKKEHQLNVERGNTDDAFYSHLHWVGRLLDCHLSFFGAFLIFSPSQYSFHGHHWLLLPPGTKSWGAHRSALDRPWLPNKSFPHFSLSLLNSFIYLPRVLPFAKSRINNVCVSFPRRLSCNNRSEDFRASLD